MRIGSTRLAVVGLAVALALTGCGSPELKAEAESAAVFRFLDGTEARGQPAVWVEEAIRAWRRPLSHSWRPASVSEASAITGFDLAQLELPGDFRLADLLTTDDSVKMVWVRPEAQQLVEVSLWPRGSQDSSAPQKRSLPRAPDFASRWCVEYEEGERPVEWALTQCMVAGETGGKYFQVFLWNIPPDEAAAVAARVQGYIVEKTTQ